MEKKDIVRNGLISATGAVPFVGNTIAFLLDKYIPSEAERKRNLFIQGLNSDLEELKERIKPEALDTPEFRSVFTRLLNATMDEYREEKIEAYRNLVFCIAIEPQKFNQIDYFSRLVMMMVPDEILVLKVFYLLDVKGELRDLDSDKEKRDIYHIIQGLYGIQDRLYLEALITECMRYQLIWGNNKKRQLNGDSREGLFLTSLGKEYLSYIFNPKGSLIHYE